MAALMASGCFFFHFLISRSKVSIFSGLNDHKHPFLCEVPSGLSSLQNALFNERLCLTEFCKQRNLIWICLQWENTLLRVTQSNINTSPKKVDRCLLIVPIASQHFAGHDYDQNTHSPIPNKHFTKEGRYPLTIPIARQHFAGHDYDQNTHSPITNTLPNKEALTI